jgi:AbrB family looped-hinge helix DNA binding protein
MANVEVGKVGKRGAVILPARLRKRFGIEDGSYVVVEEREEGIFIRPAVDKKHFGRLRGQTVEGVLALTPGDYLWRTRRQ